MAEEKKEQFNYAHADTSTPERRSGTAHLNKLCVSGDISRLRAEAQAKQIPVADDETLGFLITLALAKGAQSILEVGCAYALTSLALAENLPSASICALEKDEEFFAVAQSNLSCVSNRCRVLCGDAADLLPTFADGSFDFIFLDCAKVQYIKLLPQLKRVLAKGGVLVADDVLLNGWVNGEVPAPAKRKMLIGHIREYIEAVTDDSELSTSVIAIGDGVALSVKR